MLNDSTYRQTLVATLTIVSTRRQSVATRRTASSRGRRSTRPIYFGDRFRTLLWRFVTCSAIKAIEISRFRVFCINCRVGIGFAIYLEHAAD